MNRIVPKEHQLAGQLAILATAFLWSTSGLFIKLLNWHPMVIAGGRCLVTAVFLLILRIFFPPPKGTKNRPFPLWAGAFGNAFTMITFVIANKLTSSANVILLQYSAPVWAALLGWLLVKEKPRWEHWGALALVMAGLVIFFSDSLGTGALFGDGLSVFSGMLFGAYSVFLRMMKDGNPRDALLLSHVICAIIGLPFAVFHPPVLEVSTVLPILYMGTVQLGVTSILFAYGIKRISAVQAMLTATLEPILNPVWVLMITGERPSVSALIGGGVIISAVVVSSIIGKGREANRQSK